MPKPLMSVIIPVYRDWEALNGCLAALAKQTLPRDQFEVIVVNNGEPVPPPEAAGVDLFLHAPEGFSYQARNAGLVRAGGRFMAFTDADCLPDADWLQAGLNALEASGADVLGGDVRILVQRPTLAAWYDAAFGLKQEQYLAQFGGLATANLFVRKEVVESLGPFDAHLPSGGDMAFCQRAAAAGRLVRYDPSPVVLHPARDTWRAILGQNRRHTLGRVQRSWHDQSQSRPPLWRFLWSFYRPLLREWWSMLRAGDVRVKHYGLWRRVALVMLRMGLHYQRAWVATLAVRAPVDQSYKRGLL